MHRAAAQLEVKPFQRCEDDAFVGTDCPAVFVQSRTDLFAFPASPVEGKSGIENGYGRHDAYATHLWQGR